MGEGTSGVTICGIEELDSQIRGPAYPAYTLGPVNWGSGEFLRYRIPKNGYCYI